MKKIKQLFAVLTVCALFFFTSCEKENLLSEVSVEKETVESTIELREEEEPTKTTYFGTPLGFLGCWGQGTCKIVETGTDQEEGGAATVMSFDVSGNLVLDFPDFVGFEQLEGDLYHMPGAYELTPEILAPYGIPQYTINPGAYPMELGPNGKRVVFYQ